MSIDTLSVIAGWASRLRPEDVPREAQDLVTRAFLDTIGVSLSGSRLDSARIVADLARQQCPTGGPASVIGRGRKASVTDAALSNGTAAHAELYDDNNQPMISHPSAPLVSGLLPLAQARGLSGRDAILAYVAGFEIGVALGRRLNPELYQAGWHVTRALGVLGAAAACSRLIRLDTSRTAHAIGIAASMASGLRQNFGTTTMALHAGLAARDGVHAALLAEAGFRADAEALDGRYGFFSVFAGKGPGELPLGEPFELLASGIIFKPYPSGAPTHAAVDAAIALRGEIGGELTRIERIRCLVHPWNFMTLREGVPEDTLRARVSLRYCVAAALRFGALGSRQFDEECLRDPALRRLMAMVEIEQADDLPDNGLFPAEVRIALAGGTELSQRRDIPPGAPERPWSDANAKQKFRSCAQGVIGDDAAEQAILMITELDRLPAVADLCLALEGGG